MATANKMYNNQGFEVNVTLTPYQGEPIVLNPATVIQIVIDDSAVNFWRSGFIVFQNNNETFEKRLPKEDMAGIADAATIESATENAYVFRNDGKDKIHIQIKPVPIGADASGDIKEFPDSWTIDINANIYDKEDPVTGNTQYKVKKVYFWDENIQKMAERNIQWSTATVKQEKQTTDVSGKLETGLAIKDLLKNVMKFNINEESFDLGSSKVFHTSPNDWSVVDNINYLKANHISKEIKDTAANKTYKDICLLTYDLLENKYSFTPISEMFKLAGKEFNNPGEYQIEHQYVDEIASTAGKDSTTVRLLMSPVSKELNLEKDVFGVKLKKYSFVDASSIFSTTDYVTTPVYTYYHKTKTFVVDTQNSQAKNLNSTIKRNYLKNKVLEGPSGAESVINMNKIKKENLKINPVYNSIPNPDVSLRRGYGKMLFDSLFMNQCIYIESDGMTIRKPCRFIAIDRLTNNQNEFDYKFCGQWFITNVKHNFFKDKYVNEIIAVKPHSYEKIVAAEEVD